MDCPLCQQSPTGRLGTSGAWSYQLCQACGHGWLDPPPTPAELASFYDERYFVASNKGGYSDYLRDEPLHRLNARCRLQWLPAEEASSGSLIDVGCAAGFFLDEARSAAWQVRGVDCSDWARQQASERFGLSVHATFAEAIQEQSDEPLAAVTLFQVLEHVPDPAVLLREVWEALRPGGRVVIETWDRESFVARLCGRHWQQLTPPSVLHLFSVRSLERLAREVGFVAPHWRRTGKKVSAGFVGNLLEEKYPRLGAPLGWFTRWPGVGRLSVTYALGDLFTMSVEKPR